MRSSAFTMIELIFVIVILGILTVVAFPKLAATRDDAKLATTATNIATAGTEVASYAIATGRIEWDLSKSSNSVLSMVAMDQATLDIPNAAVNIKMGNEPDCVRLEVQNGIEDANLTIAYPNPSNDELCDELQAIIDPADYPMPLKGRTLDY